jgi:hypothetical protein
MTSICPQVLILKKKSVGGKEKNKLRGKIIF